MTFGNDLKIRKAVQDDIPSLKALVDQHRHQLGFVLRSSLQTSIEREELLVAVNLSNSLIGLVQYRHRIDGQTTLYNIVVAPELQGIGIGRSLIDALKSEVKELGQKRILLKCPVDLPSNEFYRIYGFQLIATEEGKRRPLQIWSIDAS